MAQRLVLHLLYVAICSRAYLMVSNNITLLKAIVLLIHRCTYKSVESQSGI